MKEIERDVVTLRGYSEKKKSRERKEKEKGRENIRHGVGAVEDGTGPQFEPLPVSELASILLTFHPSLKTSERGNLWDLSILEYSIQICTKAVVNVRGGGAGKTHTVRLRMRNRVI